MRVLGHKYKNNWKSPENSYYMNIGVLGPANSGKSALVGSLAHKISAVSPKAQTTHEVINVIRSHEINTELGLKNVQLNYYDTPGLMQKRGGFSTKCWEILGDINFALLVLDSTKRFEEGVRVAL
jgi:small GTP-binding protein